MRTKEEVARGKEYLKKIFDATNEAELPPSHIIVANLQFVSFLIEHSVPTQNRAGMLLSCFSALVEMTEIPKQEEVVDVDDLTEPESDTTDNSSQDISK